jgi:uncharacterized protein YecT (DUF1311 family)
LTKILLFALALFCFSGPSLQAQLDDADPQYRAVCREALAQPLTLPTADPAIKPDCDSTLAYFGIGQPVDYPAALACALAEYAQPSPALNPTNPFHAAGILSMIYANGHATSTNTLQNIELATRFTCENWAPPAEIEARLDILAEDRETRSLQPFDLCQTAHSANTDDWCTGIEARQSEVERNNAFATLRASLPATAVANFDALLAAERDYETARIQYELDLTGSTPAFAGFHTAEKIFQVRHLFDSSATGPSATAATPAPNVPPALVAVAPVRMASQLEEQNDLADHFLEDLRHITASSFAEPVARKKAEKNLETSLKLAHTAASKRLQSTTINYKGIEDTQRIWLNLRDNWLVFITTLNPSPAIGDQTAAYITLERARQINELVDTAREH